MSRSCTGRRNYPLSSLQDVLDSKARAEAAEARVAELEAELDIAHTRWQMLVNTVAGVWNHGFVPGNDEEAVEWAIQQIHEHHIALPFDGGDGE